MAGSPNDVNVLQCSPIFAKLVEGHAPPVNFEINGHQYNKGYYLADGIYPKWPVFAKTISSPKSEKESTYAKAQDAARKDVERAFGVLQQRFAVVRFPTMTWSQSQMWDVMNACICLHNMILENERDDPEEEEGKLYKQGPLAELDHDVPSSWATFLSMRQEIRDQNMYYQVRDDLMEHHWILRGAKANANANANKNKNTNANANESNA